MPRGAPQIARMESSTSGSARKAFPGCLWGQPQCCFCGASWPAIAVWRRGKLTEIFKQQTSPYQITVWARASSVLQPNPRWPLSLLGCPRHMPCHNLSCPLLPLPPWPTARQWIPITVWCPWHTTSRLPPEVEWFILTNRRMKGRLDHSPLQMYSNSMMKKCIFFFYVCNYMKNCGKTQQKCNTKNISLVSVTLLCYLTPIKDAR